MGEEFFERGLRALNPRGVVNAYFTQWTPRGLVDRVNGLSATERRWKWLALYEGLGLHAEAAGDALLSDARAAGLTEHDVREQLVELGPEVVPGLVRLLERLAGAPTFNEPGSAGFGRDGAFTREASLASDVAFLIGDVGAARAPEISALQAIVAEVEERDRQLPLAAILAENVARVLHQLRPGHFPKPVLDPRTNHLRNPELFVRRR